MVLIFYWNDDRGRERWVSIEGRFFVGRLTKDLLVEPGIYNPVNIYMYWIDGTKRIIDTGYASFFVSRKHLLVESRDNIPYIRDHGPYGKRSSNGTYINNKKILPGKWYRVNVGDIIRLGGGENYDGTRSPGFPLMVGLLGEDNKPVLTLGSGVIYLPQTIVNAALDKGVKVLEKTREDNREKPVVKARIPDKSIYVETREAQVYFDNYMFTIFYAIPELYNALAQIYKDKSLNSYAYYNIRSVVENEVFIRAVKLRCSRNVNKKLEELRNALSIGANDIAVEILHDFLVSIHKELGIKTIMQNYQ